MSHPTDTIVGQRIREARGLRGISQHALASAVGVTFQQIQKYEAGVNRISASRLLDLSQALRLPITYFFEGADPRLESSFSAANRELTEVVSAIAALPQRERRAILKLIRTIAEEKEKA